MYPNKKYIVDITKPYKWLKLLGLEKIYFCFIHVNTRVRASKLSAYCNSRNLLPNFMMEFKDFILHYKLG